MRQTILGSMVQVATCPTCGGKGTVITTPCPTCSGRGQEHKIRRQKVTVPAGVASGNQVRLAGEGQPGSNSGPAGNLYLLIEVKPHKFFRRRENDIILDLDINIPQAVLGAEVTIPTLDGEEKLKIPAGIQAGKVLRVRNKGVPYLRGGGRGDQLVVINIAIPKSLTSEQRALFDQLAKTMGSDVKPQERSFLDWLKETIGG